MKDTDLDIKKIIRDLGIDTPVLATRVVGNRIEVHCLGGQVLFWPDKPDMTPPGEPDEKKKKPKPLKDKDITTDPRGKGKAPKKVKNK